MQRGEHSVHPKKVIDIENHGPEYRDLGVVALQFTLSSNTVSRAYSRVYFSRTLSALADLRGKKSSSKILFRNRSRVDHEAPRPTPGVLRPVTGNYSGEIKIATEMSSRDAPYKLVISVPAGPLVCGLSSSGFCISDTRAFDGARCRVCVHLKGRVVRPSSPSVSSFRQCIWKSSWSTQLVDPGGCAYG